MGKGLAEITKKELNEVFNLIKIKRKLNEHMQYNITSKQPEINQILLGRFYDQRIMINPKGIFIEDDEMLDYWHSLNSPNAIKYLRRQGYDIKDSI